MRRCQNPSPRRPVAESLEARRLFAVIPGFAESLVASGLNRPAQMDFAPDGRLFITQQDGKLRVIKNGQLLANPFLTVAAHNTGESGLLGITFDPDFINNKFLYVYYTRLDGSGGFRNRVSRFTANGDVALAGSEKVLIEGDILGPGTWHQAGGLHFGSDGKLYIGTGENQQRTPAQSLNSLLGKILRINSDGTIPTDNPFYNQTTGKYRAIWAYGLRNPFTFDVQPGTGRTMVADVGSAFWEELNELQKGANYGWPNVEGPSSNSAYKNAFYSYPHAGGDNDDSAITGIAFYNPTAASFPADYIGDVFFGDYGLGTIKRIDLNTKAVSNFVSGVIEITDVDIASDGSLYYVTRNGGRVFRVHATTSSAPTIVVDPQDQTVAAGQFATFTVTAGGTGLRYQWQRNGDDIPGETFSSLTLPTTSLADDGDRFRVIVSNTSGSATSDEAALTVLDDKPPTASIVHPSQGTLWPAGGTLSFTGMGSDLEDGNLPAGSFTWRIDLHHDTHVHPFVAPYYGVTSDSVHIPATSHDGEHNLFYRIHLTVRDSLGLTDSTFLDVQPQKMNLAFRTEPAGLRVNLDGAAIDTPHDSLAIVGVKRLLAAPATQTLSGVTYAFDRWSDGGAIAHEITVPSPNTTYTAIYKVAPPQQTISLRAAADAYVRDGSANTNFGSAADLQVKNSGGGRKRDSYLSFDLSSIGSGITSAKLRLFARLDNTLAPSAPVSIFASPLNWTESGITWNNKPAAGATLLASFSTVGTTGKTHEIDLTSYIQSQKISGATMVAIVLKPGAASAATVLINSDEAGANRPELGIQTGGGSDPGPGPGPTAPGVLRAIDDAYGRDGSSASGNFGGAGELQVKKHSAAGYTRETFLKFDLSAFSSVSSAKLRLYGRLTEDQSLQTAVFSAANTNWSESTLTWNNRPTTGAATAAATTTISGTTSKWYEWDLTALLKSEKAAGRDVVTLVLRNLAQTNATLVFASDEASANRPELQITP